MPSKIEIAGEVRDPLPPDLLDDAIYAPETNIITCADCGAQMTPDSNDAISLVVRTNIVGTAPVVQYVHRRCAPSGVRRPDVTLLLADETTYLPLLRPGHPIPAGLLWEPRTQHGYPPGENAHTSHFRDLGFHTTTSGIMELDAPVLPDGCVLRSDGDDLSLQSPIGSLQQFAGVALTAPPGWYHEAHRTQHCLLLTATGLELDHPDPEHLNTLTVKGHAVAATIQTQIEPNDRG
ncbi:MAG: hypothetical protein M3071_05365 [Actinomycetota bacterium]|nr:hypothetical protein [Actinomycetota bacterium]